MNSIRWLGVILGLSGVSSLYGANLLTNPGFETNPIFPTLFTTLSFGDTSSLPGWSAIGACTANRISIMDTRYIEPSNIGTLDFFSHSGNQLADLNFAAGGVRQVVILAQGNYRLSFWVGNMDDVASNYSFPSGVQVVIQGTCPANASFVNNNNTVGQSNWQQFSMDFTCSNLGAPFPNTIDFFNFSQDGFSGLDDVFLDFAPASIPEPPTFVMAALGLVSVGLIRRVRHHRLL